MSNHTSQTSYTPWYRWYVVGICMVAYVFSYIDRQIMTLLIQPIQTDLALSDTQFGLLHGLAFALFYATMGIPIAHLSDRYSRPLIIGAGLAWLGGGAIVSVVSSLDLSGVAVIGALPASRRLESSREP